ncbi:MAG: hypothetical protein WCJ93_04590 [Methanomicrobiales archaeon]
MLSGPTRCSPVSPYMYRSRCSLVGAAYLFSNRKTTMLFLLNGDHSMGDIKTDACFNPCLACRVNANQ